MNFKISFTFFAIIVFFAPLAQAKMNVVTTTSDLKALAEAIGGDRLVVESLVKGSQDPHHLEAKPSFVLKVSHADLLISNGLGLEAAWLSKVLAGARNKTIEPGQPGFFLAAEGIEVLDIPQQKINRADGDVHQEGNPHITLDPERVMIIGRRLAIRLSQLDPEGAAFYQKRVELFTKEITDKLPNWAARIKKSGTTKVMTYHKTLNYFLQRFDISLAGYLEPHPGVSPTARHILETVTAAKQQQVKLILVENFFEETAAKRIASEVGGVSVKTVAVAIGGDPKILSFVELFEYLVTVIEGKSVG